MITALCRTVILYFLIMIGLRLMGKRQIGEMQPFELAITLIIADLACIPMTDVSIPLVYGVVAIFSIFLLHQILTLCSEKSEKLNALISGSPCLVIDPEGLRYKDIKKLNVSISDLLENVRTAGYCGFEEIQYAIMETSGNLSVVANEKQQPNKSFSQILVSNGKYNEEHLQYYHIKKETVEGFIKKYGEKSVKDILVCTINEDGDVYLQSKTKPKSILKVNS